MREQIVQQLKDRVGLDEDKANQAFDTVMDFIRDNPEKLQGLLQSEHAEKALEMLPGGLGKKLGGFLNR